MRETAKKNNIEIDDDDGEGRLPEPTPNVPVPPVPQSQPQKREVDILELDAHVPVKNPPKKDDFDFFEETFGQTPPANASKQQVIQNVDILEFDNDIQPTSSKQEHKRPGIFDITPNSGKKVAKEPAVPTFEFEYNEMDPSQFQECWEDFESL